MQAISSTARTQRVLSVPFTGSKVQFDMAEAGCPVIDLVPPVYKVIIDGTTVDVARYKEMQDPERQSAKTTLRPSTVKDGRSVERRAFMDDKMIGKERQIPIDAYTPRSSASVSGAVEVAKSSIAKLVNDLGDRDAHGVRQREREGPSLRLRRILREAGVWRADRAGEATNQDRP